ncbi:hypothetical protein K501DRAFT_275970 [Backusella circina FSU 941]|nr:hypothetical protein K501DRAFT_275970 [Backusella circina FSU 941]
MDLKDTFTLKTFSDSNIQTGLANCKILLFSQGIIATSNISSVLVGANKHEDILTLTNIATNVCSILSDDLIKVTSASTKARMIIIVVYDFIISGTSGIRSGLITPGQIFNIRSSTVRHFTGVGNPLGSVFQSRAILEFWCMMLETIVIVSL